MMHIGSCNTWNKKMIWTYIEFIVIQKAYQQKTRVSETKIIPKMYMNNVPFHSKVELRRLFALWLLFRGGGTWLETGVITFRFWRIKQCTTASENNPHWLKDFLSSSKIWPLKMSLMSLDSSSASLLNCRLSQTETFNSLLKKRWIISLTFWNFRQFRSSIR